MAVLITEGGFSYLFDLGLHDTSWEKSKPAKKPDSPAMKT